MAISALIANALKICNLRLVNKKIYSIKFFEQESEKLMASVLPEYKRLILEYPTAEDSRKGIENTTLFLEMVHWLGLEKSPPLRILDIGGRGGLFAFYCSKYGHAAFVSDLPEVIGKSPNKELHRLFGISGIPLRIDPFINVNISSGKFDLVTGFRTRFHSQLPFETGKDKEIHWGVAEWDFFLRDLAKNVLSGSGSMFFMLNRLQEREKIEYVPNELKEYFYRAGGKLRQNFLFFPSVEKLRST